MPRTTAAPTRTYRRQDLIDAYCRAAKYLPVGRIYLLDNPLLRDPLLAEHVKPRLVGYWGTRLGLPVLYVTAAGHGGPGLVANAVFIAPMLSSRWV